MDGVVPGSIETGGRVYCDSTLATYEGGDLDFATLLGHRKIKEYILLPFVCPLPRKW